MSEIGMFTWKVCISCKNSSDQGCVVMDRCQENYQDWLILDLDSDITKINCGFFVPYCDQPIDGGVAQGGRA